MKQKPRADVNLLEEYINSPLQPLKRAQRLADAEKIEAKKAKIKEFGKGKIRKG